MEKAKLDILKFIQAVVRYYNRLLLWMAPTEDDRALLRTRVVRILVVANLILGTYYIVWRYLYSINWAAWPLALALLAAETYSYIEAWLFGIMIWKLRKRPLPPKPAKGATVDVFITCYNESVELVRETTRAAVAIRYPHNTYVLDDGNSPEMKAMAEQEGAAHITRSPEWKDKPRHAKAGNMNNALFQTNGEFLLILDADQIPYPQILDKVLGYFRNPKVGFVQTPQWFYNVPPGDPYGSQAPLFYGPIQQGKDGWNAAFFCGSNAVLRREALMQVGIINYVRDINRKVRLALKTADGLLQTASIQAALSFQISALSNQKLEFKAQKVAADNQKVQAALNELKAAVREARKAMKQGKVAQEVTWEFQRRVEAVSSRLVKDNMSQIRRELENTPGFNALHLEDTLADALEDEEVMGKLARRELSPLAAIEVVRNLILALDMDRADEAIPVQPMVTISVTEDMATAMYMHSMGWHSVYHHETLVKGLAPEDLGTALQQRLRWAQGTIQVMLRKNPLTMRGLHWSQRTMYFATMWSYLSGFFSVVYLAAPVFYLVFEIPPIRAYSDEFFWHLLPFLAVNQILFFVIGWGIPKWRGQQYSLALFPLWIQSVTTAIKNVYFGGKLGFVVTSKTRQDGVHLGLVRHQLIAMIFLVLAVAFGLGRLALGITEDGFPIVINVLWACYDLAALSIVLVAATYQPEDEAEPEGSLVTQGASA